MDLVCLIDLWEGFIKLGEIEENGEIL